MPCSDNRADWGRTVPDRWNGLTGSELEALLCGITAAIRRHGSGDDFLEGVDWKEVGVTRADYDAWWKRHQAQDAARLKREAEEKKAAQLKRKALKKLSAEERKALGL